MTAPVECDLLARAEELADTADLASQITEIIGWARAARIDQAALAGLVTAVRLLDGDVTALFRAVRGRHHAGGRFGRDTELLEITADAGDEIAARTAAARQLRRQATEALQRAQADEAAAARDLSAAHAMPTAEPCRGCHGAKASAIAAAHSDLEDARERAGYASDALEVLAALKLPEALQAVRRVPEDLREVYASVYDLVTRDSQAMPEDGDFITGETSSAAMAAKMLAARARPPVPAAAGPEPGPLPAEVTVRLADGETRTAEVSTADGGSYSCPWCGSPVISPEAWQESERLNAATRARNGEPPWPPQPYPATDAAAWKSRGCPSPACWANMTADQLAAARQRDEAAAARRRERERLEQWTEEQRAERQRREDELWTQLAAQAARLGACMQCLRASPWRSGSPRLVRHRRPDFHGQDSAPATSPSIERNP